MILTARNLEASCAASRLISCPPPPDDLHAVIHLGYMVGRSSGRGLTSRTCYIKTYISARALDSRGFNVHQQKEYSVDSAVVSVVEQKVGWEVDSRQWHRSPRGVNQIVE